MEVAMTMDPTFKMTGGKDKDGRPRIEKWVMRKAFDTPDRPYLPEEVRGIALPTPTTKRRWCWVSNEQFVSSFKGTWPGG
jgi:hypothetical protein